MQCHFLSTVEMPRFFKIPRTVRRSLRTHRIKFLTSVCVFVILCLYYRATIYLTLKRDVAYITRPAWDTADGNFTVIRPIVIPGSDSGTQRRNCENNKWTYQEAHLQPRVIDALIFSNELDLLEIRIRELWDVVDIFVILESNRTFTGRPKPYFFFTHSARFQFAKSKIRTGQITTLTELRPGQNPFDNETEMRRQMTRFLQTSDVRLRAGDLLLICDLDEIPRKPIISMLKTCAGWPSPLMFQMSYFVYSYEFTTSSHVWRPKIRRIESGDVNVYTRARSSNDLLMDAGWHCSFCFRYVEGFIFKMQAFSHADRVTDLKLLDQAELQRKICNGKDIFDMYPEEYTLEALVWNWRGAHRAYRVFDLPEWLLQNPIKFAYLLPGGCNRSDRSNYVF